MIGAAHAGIIAANRGGGGTVTFDEIEYVNAGYGFGIASGTSISGSLNVSAGNLLVASVSWMYDSATVSIADDAGNTWYPLTNRTSSPDENANNQLFYAFNAKARASNVVEATLSAARGYRSINVTQYSGVENASDPFVLEDGFVTSAGAYFSKNVVVPPEQGAGLIVVGVGVYNSANSSAFAGGLTVRPLSSSSYAWLADMVNVAPGTYTPQFNHSTPYKAVGLALFKPKIL